MSDLPFGITRDEILNLAAEKLANQFIDNDQLDSLATRLVTKRVEELYTSAIKPKVDQVLVTEIERLMSQEIVPVDIWGAPTGQPTTIRAALVERARVFWSEKVNADGSPSSYMGKPRHEWFYQKIANEEFSAAIKQNIVNVIGGFKDALAKDTYANIKERIDELIRVKTPNDR